jgi:hypothetical protein
VLAWRDVSVRHKQTVIGTAWALIRPFLTMVVFTIIFGKLASLPSDGDAPYALMVFVGMLPWTFFSTALADASGCLIGIASLISKVNFPRLIVRGGGRRLRRLSNQLRPSRRLLLVGSVFVRVRPSRHACLAAPLWRRAREREPPFASTVLATSWFLPQARELWRRGRSREKMPFFAGRLRHQSVTLAPRTMLRDHRREWEWLLRGPFADYMTSSGD